MKRGIKNVVAAMMLLCPSSAWAVDLQWTDGSANLTLSQASLCTLRVVSADGSPLRPWIRLVWEARGPGSDPVSHVPSGGPGNESCNAFGGSTIAALMAHADSLTVCPTSISVAYTFFAQEGAQAVFRVLDDSSHTAVPGFATINGGIVENGEIYLPSPPVFAKAVIVGPASDRRIEISGHNLVGFTQVDVIAVDPPGPTVSLPVVESGAHFIAIPATSIAPGKVALVASGPLGGVAAIDITVPAVTVPTGRRIVLRFLPGHIVNTAGAEVVSVLESTVPDEALRNVFASNGIAELERLFPMFDPMTAPTTNSFGEPIMLEDLSSIYIARLPDSVSVDDAAAAADSTAGIMYVATGASVLQLLQVVPNDPLFGAQWGMEETYPFPCGYLSTDEGDVNAPEAWSTLARGDGIRIGIIDSGVSNTHEDLAGRVLPGPDFATGDAMGNGGCATCDTDNHGTPVASIAASKGGNAKGIAGVAWNAEIVPIRVYCDGCENSMVQLVRGFQWAPDRNIPIVNVSLGTLPDADLTPGDIDLLEDVAENLVAIGAIIIAGSGNAEFYEQHVYQYYDCFPAWNSSRVVGVGAVVPAGVRWEDDILFGSGVPNWEADYCWRRPSGYDQICHASNFDDSGMLSKYQVDVVAPGGRFVSAASANGNNAYWNLDDCQYFKVWSPTGFGGTSAAVPVVSGVAALLKSYEPTLDGTDLLEILRRTARDVYPTGRDFMTGHGLIRANAAVEYIKCAFRPS